VIPTAASAPQPLPVSLRPSIGIILLPLAAGVLIGTGLSMAWRNGIWSMHGDDALSGIIAVWVVLLAGGASVLSGAVLALLPASRGRGIALFCAGLAFLAGAIGSTLLLMAH
jgi:hypothetical protein